MWFKVGLSRRSRGLICRGSARSIMQLPHVPAEGRRSIRSVVPVSYGQKSQVKSRLSDVVDVSIPGVPWPHPALPGLSLLLVSRACAEERLCPLLCCRGSPSYSYATVVFDSKSRSVPVVCFCFFGIPPTVAARSRNPANPRPPFPIP